MKEDLLLFAIPVCAPYAAMNTFKYKVKLTPGPLKKGKAVKQALTVFMAAITGAQKERDADQQLLVQERELLKVSEELEAIQQIIGDVRIQTPGLLALQQNQKKNKKKGGKNKNKKEDDF